MDRKLKTLLYDIKEHIILVETFIGTSKMYKLYIDDIQLQYSVERCLGIIGEATNNLIKLQPDIAITNARKIVNLRNMLAHEYFRKEPENIWSVIINHLPTLKIEVEKLLNE